jgi:hypothetical protein
MSSSELNEMNLAILSALASFDQNSATSEANAAWSTALDAAPASVTSSLFCSGYGGINVNSLPGWLSSVPTSYVSAVLQQEAVYQAIISSYVAEAETESTTTAVSSLVSSRTTASSSVGILTESASVTSSISPATSTTANTATSAEQPSQTPSLSWAPKLFDYCNSGALAAICLAFVLAL